jgi:hypothetical protein
MSRSYKRHPIVPYTTAKSEKWDKQKASRRLRKAAKLALAAHAHDDLPADFADLRTVSNVWVFAKDGRHWWQDPAAYRK